MIWRIQFTALAADDVADAYAWYAASRSGLGEAFLADVERVLEVIKQYPEACPVAHLAARPPQSVSVFRVLSAAPSDGDH